VLPGCTNGGENGREFPAQRIHSMKLYVGNLSYNISEDDLRGLFSTYGTPESVRIITDRDTGRAKGFGFVEFADDQEARTAMSALNGKEIGGRPLRVNEARPQEQRGGGGYGNAGGGRGRRY
jgi:cold-inducible RNA-binding protein